MTDKKKFIIGSRGSKLSLAYSNHVKNLLIKYNPQFDNNSIEQWEADGSKDTIQRGIEGAKKLLADYQEPKLDEDKDEELLDFIARRETTIPAMEALNQEY